MWPHSPVLLHARPLLRVQSLEVLASVDLTAGGALDWVHWGHVDASSINRRAGATTQIGTLSGVGGTPSRYAAGNITFTWTGGTPTASAASAGGLYIIGKDNGFALTAPAGTSPRTLVLYLGGWQSTSLTSLTLSDGSAPPVPITAGTLAASYRLRLRVRYRAGSTGQTLSISHVATAVSGQGNVSFEAAALS